MDSSFILYLDTSVVLSLILNDSGSSIAERYWSRTGNKFSSILLRAETYNSLNRSIIDDHKLGPKLKQLHDRTDILMDEINTITLNENIISIIRANKDLGRCRSLDAIHLATVIYLQNNSDLPIKLGSTDKKMIAAAKELGIGVI